MAVEFYSSLVSKELEEGRDGTDSVGEVKAA
jgi:hypothetical protein